MSRGCMNPPAVIARSEPDPELAGLYAELRRRYPLADIQVYRQLRDSGPSHLSVSIDAHSLNRRRAYNLGTDTADRALCCIDEWERSLTDSAEAPPHIFVACCLRCGEPVSAVAAGLSRMDLYGAKCPKCPDGTRTEIFSYVPGGEQ